METTEETELCFPQLLNASCVKTTRPHFEIMLTYVLLSSVCLLSATLNVLVIISISHFKQLHTPTNFLILSLAVSDFFMGLFLLFPIMVIDGCWYLGDLICAVYTYLAYIIPSTSIGIMVLICVDRYVAICDPLHYSTKITQSRVKICVCLCWTCSIIYASLILMDVLEQPGRSNSCFGQCMPVISYFAEFADIIISFLAPITVVVSLYMRVFVVAVSQARAMRSQMGSMKVSAKKSEIKAARTLGVVVVVFIICLCPFYCVALIGQDNLLSALAAAFVIPLYDFNACLNPLIYALFYPWFRKSVKLIVTLKILQPGSCETNIL